MLPKALRPSKNELIKRFNLKQSVYYYWRRHPIILELKRILTKRYFQDDIPDILQALRDEAIAGNPKAADLFLKYVDDWQDNSDKSATSPVVLNLTQVNIMLEKFREKNI